MSTVYRLCMKTLFIKAICHIGGWFGINQVTLRLCIKGISKLLMMRLHAFMRQNLVINHACRLTWLLLLWMHVYNNLRNTPFVPCKNLMWNQLTTRFGPLMLTPITLIVMLRSVQVYGDALILSSFHYNLWTIYIRTLHLKVALHLFIECIVLNTLLGEHGSFSGCVVRGVERRDLQTLRINLIVIERRGWWKKLLIAHVRTTWQFHCRRIHLVV